MNAVEWKEYFEELITEWTECEPTSNHDTTKELEVAWAGDAHILAYLADALEVITYIWVNPGGKPYCLVELQGDRDSIEDIMVEWRKFYVEKKDLRMLTSIHIDSSKDDIWNFSDLKERGWYEGSE